MEVLKLYPQFNQLTDRRQENKPVENDRRSGMDKRVIVDSRLSQDLKQVKDTFKAYVPQNNSDFYKQNVVLEGVLSTIPSTRRLVNVEDNKDNNKVKAAGLGLIGLINTKEDIRDLMSIIGRSKSNAPDDYFSKFKFFAGTPIEKWLEKSELGQKFYDTWDITLADTRLGRNIYSMFDVKRDLRRFEKQIKYPFCKPETVFREYIKLDSSFIGRLAGLTMNRITKIGLVSAALMETSIVYKAIKDKKDYSQIPKSAVNVLSCSICGALGSAFLSLLTCHSAGSVIGLGLGLYIGNKLSKYICRDK